MPKRQRIVHSNYFTLYDRAWGQSLMAEAQARGLTRSEFVRVACRDYLDRHPVNPTQGNPNARIQDR